MATREFLARALNASKAATEEINHGLSSIRDQILHLKAEARGIENAAVPEEEALRRVDDWVYLQSRDVSEAFPSPDRFAKRHKYYTMPDVRISTAISALLAGQVAEEMKRRVKEHYASLRVPNEEEREVRSSALDRQLLDCELTEESIIRQAEAAGLPVLRRSDADPRAVLAHDKVLP